MRAPGVIFYLSGAGAATRAPSEKLSRRRERLHLVCEFCVMQKRDALCASVNVAARARPARGWQSEKTLRQHQSFLSLILCYARTPNWMKFRNLCVLRSRYAAAAVARKMMFVTARGRIIWYRDRTPARLTADKEKFSLWWGLNNATGGMNSPSRFHVLIKLLPA